MFDRYLSVRIAAPALDQPVLDTLERWGFSLFAASDAVLDNNRRAYEYNFEGPNERLEAALDYVHTYGASAHVHVCASVIELDDTEDPLP